MSPFARRHRPPAVLTALAVVFAVLAAVDIALVVLESSPWLWLAAGPETTHRLFGRSAREFRAEESVDPHWLGELLGFLAAQAEFVAGAEEFD